MVRNMLKKTEMFKSVKMAIDQKLIEKQVNDFENEKIFL